MLGQTPVPEPSIDAGARDTCIVACSGDLTDLFEHLHVAPLAVGATRLWADPEILQVR